MKVRLPRHIHVLVWLLLMMPLVQSCEDLLLNPMTDKETGEDISLLLLDVNFFDTRFTLHLVDYFSGEYVDDTPVEVYFTGKSAGHIVNMSGWKNDGYTVTNGRLHLNVDPNVPISLSDPLEFTVHVYVPNSSYDAYPTEVYRTSVGVFDKNIRMIPMDKSDKVTASEAEPFDVLFNDQPILASNDPVWSVQPFTAQQDGKTYYRFFNSESTPQGVLLAENFARDTEMYSNWGLEGVYMISNTGSFGFDLTNQPIEVPANVAWFKAYSATQSTHMIRCEEGIDIHIQSENGHTGTGLFSYELYIDGEVNHSEHFSFSDLPVTVNTGAFYYPADASTAIMHFTGDSQYIVDPQQVTLDGFCNQRVEITAEVREGLVPHKIITSYQCSGEQYAVAPTINGRYRLQGSDQPWTYVKLTEGIATLMLEPGETYTVVVEYDDSDFTYDLPTDPDRLDEVVRQAIAEYEEISNISCSIEEMENGVVEIRVRVYVAPGHCPVD